MRKGYIDEPPPEHVLSDKALEQYAEIATEAAQKIRMPGAFTSEGLCLDRDGNGTSVWSDDPTCMRDALGWVLKVARRRLLDRSSTCVLSFRASAHIGSCMVQMTGWSMIGLGDEADGCERVATALEGVAQSFREELALRHPVRIQYVA